MKRYLQVLLLSLLCLSAKVSQAQQNCADNVISQNNVTNAQNAVDGDQTNFAVLRASIGVLNSSQLTLGFSPNGTAGQTAVVELQNDNGLISADVLESISITLFDNDGNIVARKNGFDVADADIIQGSSHFKLHLGTADDISNIAKIKIRITGLATLENRIRIFDACLVTNCGAVRGDILHSNQNVENPENAVSDNKHDFALLTPPLLLGTSFLDIKFSTPGDAGKLVGFRLGEGDEPLDATLLENIKLTVYDVNGNVVVSKNGFTLADIDVLSNGKFFINLKTPKGSYQIGRARITLTGIANVLTTLKVYAIVTHQDCSSGVAQKAVSATSLSELKVFPNPFNSYTTLNTKGDVKETTQIVVSDKTGIVVEQHAIAGVSSTRLLEKAAPGLYFVKITSGNITQTQTVVKL